MFKAPVDLPDYEEYIESMMDNEYYSEETSPRRLNATTACIGGLTPVQHKDAQEVSKWAFVREYQCTTLKPPCPQATATGEPCLKKEYRGFIVVYIFGMGYMFLGLAIVCDEFFVPSLEEFSTTLGISDDVAGATFMAAGGSMPELLTSFISTMRVPPSDIGFAAIVGSAVFNVLFVIAVCAIASPIVLNLDWYPLGRDSLAYLICLLTLYLCLKVGEKEGEIEWYEALILLCEYFAYCAFMTKNPQVQEAVKPPVERFIHSKCSCFTQKVHPDEPTEEATKSAPPNSVSLAMPSSFRVGIVQLLTQNAPIADTAGVAAVAVLRGGLQETFKQLDKDGNGLLDEDELAELITSMNSGSKVDAATVAAASRSIAHTDDGQITFDAFQIWYLTSEFRMKSEVRKMFERFDANGDGSIDKIEIKALLESLGHHPSEKDLSDTLLEMSCDTSDTVQNIVDENEPTAKADAEVSFDQFTAWYNKSMFWNELHNKHVQEAEAIEGFNLDSPQGGTWVTWAMYILAYPLNCLMYCSMPDIRRPQWKDNWKMAVAQFIISLGWIALFATALYEWTVLVANTIGIPSTIAAITILAGGTSIPDLLSSYVVAKQKKADMAVSSSLGSNIFDITVGLPLPWLCFSIRNGFSAPVKMCTASLGFSLALLIIMLAGVIFVVMLCRWKMSPALGYAMFALYILFLLQDCLRNLPSGNPVWNMNEKKAC